MIQAEAATAEEDRAGKIAGSGALKPENRLLGAPQPGLTSRAVAPFIS
jgi:hypothetical protein